MNLRQKELEAIKQRIADEIVVLKSEVLILSDEKSLSLQSISENRTILNDLNYLVTQSQKQIDENNNKIKALQQEIDKQNSLIVKISELENKIKELNNTIAEKRLAIEEINKIKPIDYWPLNKSLEEEITKKRTILQTIESTIWEKNKILSALEEKSKGIVKDLEYIEEQKTLISIKEKDILIREKRVFIKRPQRI